MVTLIQGGKTPNGRDAVSRTCSSARSRAGILSRPSTCRREMVSSMTASPCHGRVIPQQHMPQQVQGEDLLMAGLGLAKSEIYYCPRAETWVSKMLRSRKVLLVISLRFFCRQLDQ